MDRRTYLTTIGATGVSTIAGCLGSEGYLPQNSDDSSVPGAYQNGNSDKVPDDFDADGITDAEVLDIGKQLQKSVVEITSRGSGGTGWFLDENTIVTNSHILKNMDESSMEIELYSGEIVSGTIEGLVPDMQPDVGAITVNPPEDAEYTSLTVGDSSTLEEGSPLVQVGHPVVIGKWVISVGVMYQRRPDLDWMLSTVPTLSGNSGSPVVNTDGEVVGLTSGETDAGTPVDYRESDKVFREFQPLYWTTHTPIEVVLDHLDNW